MPDTSNSGQTSWNNNNLACTDTWGYLFLYEELNVGFADAANVKMSDLAFFNPAVSAGMLDNDAEELAARLNRAYVKKSHAQFEQGWDEPKAIEALKAILKNKDKTVSELATKVDEIYSFSGEKH